MTDAPALRTLDHVGVGVRDLDVAARTYERLGFRLTRRALLLVPGTNPVEWRHSGASNHCAVFHEGYIELVSITDSSRGNKFAAEIERYEGLHVIALGTPSADQAWEELRVREIVAARPEVWGREVFRDEARDVAQFKFVVVPRTLAREGVVIAVEHLTPELVRTSDLLDHPNGVMRLAEVMLCASDVEEACRRYRQVLGIPDVPFGAGRALNLPSGRLVVVDQNAQQALYPDAHFPPPPSLIGFTVRVNDLQHTWNFLTARGVALGGDPARGFWVDPNDALGVAIRFHRA